VGTAGLGVLECTGRKLPGVGAAELGDLEQGFSVGITQSSGSIKGTCAKCTPLDKRTL
jgi:hypothetical protein